MYSTTSVKIILKIKAWELGEDLGGPKGAVAPHFLSKLVLG